MPLQCHAGPALPQLPDLPVVVLLLSRAWVGCCQGTGDAALCGHPRSLLVVGGIRPLGQCQWCAGVSVSRNHDSCMQMNAGITSQDSVRNTLRQRGHGLGCV